MSTRGQMKTEMSADLGTSAFSADYDNLINNAIKDFQSKRWFQESRSKTFATVASQGVYSESDDADIGLIIKLDDLFIERTDADFKLREINIRTWEVLSDAAASSGEPYDYAYYDDKIHLYRTPDQAYTMRMHGVFKVAGPSSDDEADNKWMTEAFVLIKARVLRYIAQFRMKDYELAGVMSGEVQEQYRRLTREYEGKQASRRITPTEF